MTQHFAVWVSAVLMVLGPKAGFVLGLTKGHTQEMVACSRFCTEPQECISLGSSGLKNVDSPQRHHDSLYLLGCSMHFLVHPAARPGGTENLHMHYSCQSGLQVVSEELKASRKGH